MAWVVMTQQNMRKGLNIFGDQVAASIKKQVRQLLNLESINPEDRKELTKGDRHAFLLFLIFVKDKHSNIIGAEDYVVDVINGTT